MAPQMLIDYINMNDCHGESYEIFDCMSEFRKVKPLRYKGWQPGCLIEVVDEAGKVVLFVFLLVFLFIFFVFLLIFFYLFFSFFSFFSLFTKSSFDSPGISVSKKVQLLMPSYTSFSDMEFISAGHSSGCSFQRFLCCSMIPRAMLACTRRGRGFRLPVHFYNHYVRQTT